MYRCRINLFDKKENKEYNDWGIVGTPNMMEATRQVLEFYGANLEKYYISSFTIYELENILCEEEISEMFEDTF